MPKLFVGLHPSVTVSAPNISVPAGHRSKCRTCGAVDNVARTSRRSFKCGACGSTHLTRRRAPRKPNVKSWVVVLAQTEEHISEARRILERRLRDIKLHPQHIRLLRRVCVRLAEQEQEWSKQVYVHCEDIYAADACARRFAEKGPMARSRVAQVIELLDGDQMGDVKVLRWDNFRTRRGSMEWSGGCEGCKGRGTVAVRIPSRSPEEKSTVKFVACGQCNGLGGQLSREVNYRRLRT
jgi:hypothetical protein